MMPILYRTKVVIQLLFAMLMLLCGSGIYLLFRSKSLYIYKWCVTLGFSDGINSLRYVVSDWTISEFVKYCLPDGLYSAAYILIMDAIWHKENGWMKYAIIFLVPFITISSEILQLYGVVRGTFDYRDLICYAIPPIAYLYYTNRIIKKKEMKKLLYTMFALALFAVGFAASDEEESASSSNEQKQEQKQEQKKENNIVGTYEVTDNVGCTIRITLKEDETATITGVRGENVTYYCTWHDQSYHKNRMALIELSDNTKRPYLVFDGGTTADVYDNCYSLSKDGWLYYNVMPETNNPEWRLKATKIK